MTGFEALKALLTADEAGRPDASLQGAYAASLDAAAVSSFFDPEELAFRLDASERGAALERLKRDCIVLTQGDRPLWMLATPRRKERLCAIAAAGRLSSAARELRVGQDNSTTRAFRLYVEGSAKPVAEQSFEELAGTEQALGWLRGVLPGLPNEAEVGGAIARCDLLSPMLELAGTAAAFAGRERELAELHAFVGDWTPEALPWARTIGITGLGGTGKSALLMKFLLEEGADGPGRRLRFAYLDLGKAMLPPDDPGSLALEIMRQLAIQIGKGAASLAQAASLLRSTYVAGAAEAAEEASATPGTAQDPRTEWVVGALALAVRSAGLGTAPILVALDHMEEAEQRSQPGMPVLADFVRRLLASVPALLLVVCGRSLPAAYKAGRMIQLSSLDPVAAVTYLQARGLSAHDAVQVQAAVGGFPLAIRLAAEFARDGAVAALLGSLPHGGAAAAIAERLYDRVLGHVGHPVVRRLFDAALPLRKITPGVVREVMAPACELPLSSEDADRLYGELREQAALLVDEGTHLRCRPDVAEVARRARSRLADAPGHDIHSLAAEFWARSHSRTGDAADLAEEIYHRLAGGATLDSVQPLWRPEAAPHLRAAVDQLPRVAAGILALLLGDARRAGASGVESEEPEAYGLGLASQLLREERLEEALAYLRRARPVLGPLSEAALLEAEALEGLLRWQEARAVLEAARAGRPSDPDIARALCSLLLRLGDHARCASVALEALGSNGTGRPSADLDIALDWLASTRLPGGGTGGQEAAARALSAAAAIAGTGGRASPQSLRRLALLAGEAAPGAVEAFLRHVGLPDASSAEKFVLTQALAAWDRRSSHRRGEEPGGLARAAGLPRRETEADRAWARYMDAASHAQLSELLPRLLDSRPLQIDDAADFLELIGFRQPEWRPAAIQAISGAFSTPPQLAGLAGALCGDEAATVPSATAAELVRWADSEGLLPKLMRCALAVGKTAKLEMVSEALDRWIEASRAGPRRLGPGQASPKRPDAPGVPLFDLMKRYYEMPFPDRAQLGRELSLVDGSECIGDAPGMSRLILARARERGGLGRLAARMGLAPTGNP